MEERRHRRSEAVIEAIRLQLETCEEDFELDSMILVDDHGMIFGRGKAKEGADEALAAFAPLLYEAEQVEGGELTRSLTRAAPELRGRSIKVRRLEISGEVVFLCGTRTGGAPSPESFDRAEAGLRRILV